VALHVPVDEDPAAAVADVPLGEDVLVVGVEVGGVRRDGGGAVSPDGGLAGGEGGVGDAGGGTSGGVEVEVAAAGVAQVILAVAMLALGDAPQTGVGA